ncbi:MAG: Dephospho-CoA kinase [Phycisphaerae bacterium]|nr:Dephospho-CoA kinase [Phycisphaerae bacterium]
MAGGIGAGKSTVAREFARLGCRVIDSDADAHAVLRQPEVADAVRRLLEMPDLDTADPQARRLIARRVFGRPDLVDGLNRLIHPRVHAMRRATLAELAGDDSIVAFVLDTPLLFEAGVDGECDALVFVEASEALRQQRVASSRGWSADDLAARQGHQMDLAEKRRRCGWVVRNDGDLADLQRQVARTLEEILKQTSRGRAAPDRPG